MDRLDMILYEFDNYSNKVWTVKAREIVELKDKEIESKNVAIRSLNSTLISLEQQKNKTIEQMRLMEKQHSTDLGIAKSEISKLNDKLNAVNKTRQTLAMYG